MRVSDCLTEVHLLVIYIGNGILRILISTLKLLDSLLIFALLIQVHAISNIILGTLIIFLDRLLEKCTGILIVSCLHRLDPLLVGTVAGTAACHQYATA